MRCGRRIGERGSSLIFCGIFGETAAKDASRPLSNTLDFIVDKAIECEHSSALRAQERECLANMVIHT